jgi:hypothetical protein
LTEVKAALLASLSTPAPKNDAFKDGFRGENRSSVSPVRRFAGSINLVQNTRGDVLDAKPEKPIIRDFCCEKQNSLLFSPNRSIEIVIVRRLQMDRTRAARGGLLKRK